MPRVATFLLVLIVIFSGAYALSPASVNHLARTSPIFAFVEPGTEVTGTFRIEPFARFDPDSSDYRSKAVTHDWAQNPEHDSFHYSNKAPGSFLVGIPIYFLLYVTESAMGIQPEGSTPTYINIYLLNFFLSVLPAAFLVLYLQKIIFFLEFNDGPC